jgi:hypothetical protein
MSPWASAAPYGRSEKFLAQLTTDVKLGTSGRWVGTRKGAGVTATLVKAFLVSAYGAMGYDKQSFTLLWR